MRSPGLHDPAPDICHTRLGFLAARQSAAVFERRVCEQGAQSVEIVLQTTCTVYHIQKRARSFDSAHVMHFITQVSKISLPHRPFGICSLLLLTCHSTCSVAHGI